MHVDIEIRDSVVAHISYLKERTGIPLKRLLGTIGLSKVKYHRWKKRQGIPNNHNGSIPKKHWLTPEEIELIKEYAMDHYSENDYYLRDGYRRITYKMMDLDIVAVSPSTVYRILRQSNLLNKWNTKKTNLKGSGFKQPNYPHRDWHIDIKYLNFRGTFLFLITVLDGYSRYVLNCEVRRTMTEYDIELTIQGAKDKYPAARPRIITDNGSQFISKEFRIYIQNAEFEHIKTSIRNPQANGKIERYHRTINEECLRITSPVEDEDLIESISEYIDHYNSKRLHASLYYLTPEDYLLGRVEQRLSERENKLIKAEKLRADYWRSKNIAA